MSYRVFGFVLRTRKWGQYSARFLPSLHLQFLLRRLPFLSSAQLSLDHLQLPKVARQHKVKGEPHAAPLPGEGGGGGAPGTGDVHVSETPPDKQPEIDITAFDQLVLPPGHHKMVTSLVTQHFRDKTQQARLTSSGAKVRMKKDRVSYPENGNTNTTTILAGRLDHPPPWCARCG